MHKIVFTFRFPNVSGVDEDRDVPCMTCVGAIGGFPCSNYSDTTLRCETSPALPPTTLRDVISMKSLLVQMQSPVSH